MLIFFRILLTVWPLGALTSAVTAVPWDAAGRNPRTASDDCGRVAASFVQITGHDSHAIPTQKIKDDELEICRTLDHRKTCCTRSMERRLHAAAVDGMRDIMSSASRHLKDLLIINSELYRNEFLNLLSASKNATKLTLSHYNLPSTEVSTMVDDLFFDLGHFVQQETKDTTVTMTNFFDALFPPVLIYTINDSDGSLVPPAQRSCFRKARKDLFPSPFADSIRHLSRDLERSLGVARFLLDAFDLALEVINTTNHLHFEHACSRGLTRLLHCSYCDGHTEIRPCRNLCMNVVHGCLAQVAELDVQWNLFVDAVERAVMGMRGAFNLQDVLATFHSKISDSIRRSMETVQKYHSQLVSRCGSIARVSQANETASDHSSAASTRRPSAETPARRPDGQPPPPPPQSTRGSGAEVRLHLKIEMFVKNLAESREFYRKLPDSLCSSEKLSAGNYDVCWNGTSLGAYTRPVPLQDYSIQVADNPEVRVSESRQATLQAISEKLENMTKILHSKVIQKISNVQSTERATDDSAEASGYGTDASGDGRRGYDGTDDDDGSGSAADPEDRDSVPELMPDGKGGRKGVGGGADDEEENGVAYVTSADFVFTEKSTRKSRHPYATQSPTDVVVTFTHTGTGSAFTHRNAGYLLLATLSISISLRVL